MRTNAPPVLPPRAQLVGADLRALLVARGILVPGARPVASAEASPLPWLPSPPTLRLVGDEMGTRAWEGPPRAVQGHSPAWRPVWDSAGSTALSRRRS